MGIQKVKTISSGPDWTIDRLSHRCTDGVISRKLNFYKLQHYSTTVQMNLAHRRDYPDPTKLFGYDRVRTTFRDIYEENYVRK